MRKIKLFLSLLMVMLVSVGNVWATDVSFGPTDFSGKGTPNTGSEMSVTKDGVTISIGKGYGTTEIRAYSGSSLSISSSNTITALSFTFSGGKTGGLNTSYTNLSTSNWSQASLSSQARFSNIIVTYTPAAPSTPTVSVDPTVIDFGTVDQGAPVEAQEVTVTYENLTGAVAYSGLSGAFAASGTIAASGNKITITPNTANTGNFQQTLTVQSAADSKSAEVTVKMNVVEPFDGKKLTFDVSSNPGGWPTTNSTTTTDYTYTLNAVDYTFALNNVKCNSGYLMLTSVAKLGLPAISGYKLVKVEATNSSGCSTTTQVSVSSSDATKTDVTGGTAQTWGTTSTKYTYNLSGTEENTMYYLWIAKKNCQLVELVLYYEEAEAATVATPVISGTESFLTSTEVSIACTTDGATVYYTTDGTDPKTSESKQTYSAAFTLTNTATVRAIATKDAAWSSEATSKTFSKITPLTVANALSATSGDNVYVTGTITSITEVNVGYKNATYVISDVTAGVPANEMIIYRGKYVNGADFTSEDQIHVGDVVVVSGTIGVYQSKNQLAQGNQIESITPAAVVAPVFSPNGGGFMGETDVTITCETEGSAIYYTLDGTTPTKSSTQYTAAIHLDATTTITAIAFVGEESSLVVAKEFTLTAPMTVAEAYDALTGDDINNAAVAGIVYQVDNISNGHATYWISDNGEAGEKVLEVYNGYGLNGASIAAGGIQVGDEVTVFGNLTIYVKNETSTKEFAAGSRLLAFNRPVVAVTDIDLTESTAEVEVDKTVTLHASVVPANATNKTIVWSVQSGDDYASVDENGVVTGIAAGEAVIRATSDEDATIYAECTVTVTAPTPLSPWATTYTSNVAMAHTGSGVDNGTITIGTDDPYLLVKAGASSSTGTIIVTVPKGTTDLHFHAFAWGGKTAKIELAGVENASVSEFDLAGEAGASGSGNDFTLQGDPVDQYFHVSFDAVAAETEITFSKATGSADNRFFFYGVNQEGGLILESISVSGTAAALEYNDGDHFSPAGLVVTGHYSNASTAPITEGIVWAFDPDPLTEGTESVSVIATAGGKTSTAFVVNGLTVNGAAPLSPWATTYTSNVAMAHTGSGVDNGTITIGTDDPYLLVKAGASSSTGTIVVTVPKGTTDLHFHAFAWGGKTAKIELAGVENASVSEFDLAGEAGASGSGNDFTLQGDPVDQYFHVSFDAVAAETEITFSKATGSADNRFFFYGVNQEGGIVPVLDRIEISGDLTNKSGYKAGDDLNMEGLTVNAIYTLNEVEQDPVDVTADVDWSYDALVENQTEVTVTATYGEKQAQKTITDLEPVASADPKIYVSTLNVNFASVEVGESVPAAETVIVTLTNVASVTATLGGTNADAFSVSPASLTESGDITISILANTDAAASYAATLTISDGEGGADDKTINLSFAVTEPVVEDDVTGTWTLVTNATTLAAGKKVIIAQYVEADGAINTMAGQASNNRSVIASTVAGATLTPTVGTKVMTLADAGEGHFYLKTSDGEYLYNASGTKSYLRTKATSDDASWTIEVDADGVATITAVENTTRPIMRYNPNTSGSPLFNCYASGQEDIALYMLEEDAPEPPTPSYTEVREGLIAGNYYTICYPKSMTDVQGATLWSFVGKDANFAYIEQETATTIEAGKPYIMYATASTVTAVLGTDVASAGVNGAIHGTLDPMVQSDLDDAATDAGSDVYLVIGNELRRATGEGTGSNTLPANRAFVVVGDIPAAPAHMPAHVRAMPMHKDAATGLDALNASDKPVKMVINGQLFILRGEKMYDATGRLVK